MTTVECDTAPVVAATTTNNNTSVTANEAKPVRAAPKKIAFNLYDTIYKARSTHGCLTEDYTVYRQYLSKQISLLRKKFALQCMDAENHTRKQKENRIRNRVRAEKLKKVRAGKLKLERDPNWNPKYKKPKPEKQLTWQHREIALDDLLRRPQCLFIAAYLCERAWSYSRSLYDQYDEDHKRKYHHSNSRLRKAIAWSEKMYQLLRNARQQDVRVDGDTMLQCVGYMAWLRATYFLQREQLAESYEEYRKWMKVTPARYRLLENNSETALNAKMMVFEVNLSRAQRAQIERNVDVFVTQLKLELHVEETATTTTPTETVYLEYEQQKLAVPDVGGLPAMMAAFQSELELHTNADAMAAAKPHRKLNIFTRLALMADKALTVVQTELKQVSNDAGSNTWYLLEKYLAFQKLRFTVCRQYLWLRAVRAQKHQRGRMLYELALCSEHQIRHLDELSSVRDLSHYPRFMQQIQVLRDLFEISRNFYIANVYFVARRNYGNAWQLLEQRIVGSAADFVANFPVAIGRDDDVLYDFDALINVADAKSVIQDVCTEAQKLCMLSKANYVLHKQAKQEVYDELDEQAMKSAVIDLDRRLYPVLTKPTMIDVAWSFVDYHDVVEASGDKRQQPTRQNQPAAVKTQTSWFGGLFGK